jgi:hypothetical protein
VVALIFGSGLFISRHAPDPRFGETLRSGAGATLGDSTDPDGLELMPTGCEVPPVRLYTGFWRRAAPQAGNPVVRAHSGLGQPTGAFSRFGGDDFSAQPAKGPR